MCEGRGEAQGHVLHDQDGDREVAREKRATSVERFGAAGGNSNGNDRRAWRGKLYLRFSTGQDRGGFLARTNRGRELARIARRLGSWRRRSTRMCRISREVGRQLFGNVVEGPGGESASKVFSASFSVARTYHDHGAGKLFHDATQSPQSIEPGHLNVEGNHIRIE